ncbi:MAG: polyprenyl synthetase family protein [Peptococcaceae bacterium]|jgi:geranylgeranyl diphosphate synthase type II|nr:polyprenyl synthetase family protein [Peptococcaceae bacterium]MDH7525337.1 polyprenyl synthetase family protein [Peptococcaceae bacterium]
MDLKKYLLKKAGQVDKALSALLPENSVYPEIIHEAMRYSLFAGGKRLRPILCLASAEALGKESGPLLPVACALEMVHTYSLIHDDLPAMDDDDYRRGKLTSHKVFGEGIAILAGDALLTRAFELLAEFGCQAENSLKPVVLQVTREVARAAGSLGMIGGQVVDLLSEGKPIEGDTLTYIHTHKTGALFLASVRAGALLCGASEKELDALTAYAENFGLAFQITDDLLDITGDEAKLGKPVGSDVRNEKVTYPSLYGLEKSRVLAEEAVKKAVSAVGSLPGSTGPLEQLAQYLLERET